MYGSPFIIITIVIINRTATVVMNCEMISFVSERWCLPKCRPPRCLQLKFVLTHNPISEPGAVNVIQAGGVQFETRSSLGSALLRLMRLADCDVSGQFTLGLSN